MFADEARFGRMNRPRPCWAPAGIRPKVASQLIREYIYLYGAVCPKDGTCVYLIMPTSDTACFQAFLDVLSRKFARHDILLVVDGAPNHHSGHLIVPDNIKLLLLLCVCLLLCSLQSAAQAALDPSLPPGSQPLVKRRLLHLFPDFESVQPGAHVAPLSTRQKFQLFAGETFDPSLVLIAAGVAGIQQGGNLAPHYGQGSGPYAQRFGATTASFAFAGFYSQALLPTLFRQDPRYFRKGSGSVSSRL